MKPLLLLTRPAEDCIATAEAARKAGFASLIVPLVRIEAVAFKATMHDCDALLFTSPQAPRHAAELPDELAALPAYAVGAATARAAAAAGFSVIATGTGDASQSVAIAAKSGARRLLHLCGKDVTALTLPPGLELRQVCVYRAVLADALPFPARRELAEGAVFATLLYSGRTAARFVSLLTSAGLDRASLRIACLSPAIASAAGEGWQAVAVAGQPNTTALLAAARALWQSDADG